MSLKLIKTTYYNKNFEKNKAADPQLYIKRILILYNQDSYIEESYALA